MAQSLSANQLDPNVSAAKVQLNNLTLQSSIIDVAAWVYVVHVNVFFKKAKAKNRTKTETKKNQTKKNSSQLMFKLASNRYPCEVVS